MTEPKEYVEGLARNARRAGYALAGTDGAKRSAAVLAMADGLAAGVKELLAANALDMAAAAKGEMAAVLVSRLKLDEKKVAAMVEGVRQIAAQTDPIGQTIEAYNRPNGLRVEKRRAPLGVVLFFYESRPNVTSDAAALCIKSGNAIILRGGKEALNSNRAIAGIIAKSLEKVGMDSASVQVVENTDRALVPMLLKLDKYIDLVIPRGGESLIRTVVAESTIPVLKHFTGNCHIYVDKSIAGMEQQVRDICINAKVAYPAACNAVEHILVHAEVAGKMLPLICGDLAGKGVEIRADERTKKMIGGNAVTASEADWDEEYLALIAGVKVVDSIEEAIAHINAHSSHHTDAILSTDLRAADRFVREVDSGSVMVNASTRFADGGEYGLGAEIGISTDKLHARGPMGATDLTTYKWVVTGDGHIRA